MSGGLLKAARLHKPYLQSPVDDLWSFYYVAQWAAVFNKTNFPENTSVPDELTDLRCLIAGSESDRALGTSTVTGPVLDATECGQFLVDCSFPLREWETRLSELTTVWKLSKVDSLADCTALYQYFRTFTNRGVLELVQLVQKYFPGSL
jgi:hypothetical protein